MPSFVKRYGAFCCIAALLAAGMGTHVSGVAGCADVNADGLLDVLDVQAIAAGILAFQSPQDIRDVNGDGQIDVRDFQVAVAELGHSGAASNEPLPEPTDSNAYISHERRMVPAFVNCPTAALVQPHRPVPRRTGVWLECKAAVYQSERFLFHLTPNAPPCHA